MAGRAAVWAAALLAAGCATAAEPRLELASPAPAAPGVLRDGDLELRVYATFSRMAVTLRNLTDEELAIEWGAARFYTVAGEELGVVALRTLTVDGLDGAAARLRLAPGGSWSGFVHPRRGVARGRGRDLRLEPLVRPGDAALGRQVRLDLPVTVGERARSYELRFALPAPGA